MGNSKAQGWAILRSRSLPAAALFFFVLLDEIEGFAFIALGVLGQRVDLFVDTQNVLFPTAIFVSGIATAWCFWRRRDPVVEPPADLVSADVLVARIGAPALRAASHERVHPDVERDVAGLWAVATPVTEAKWRRHLRS